MVLHGRPASQPLRQGQKLTRLKQCVAENGCDFKEKLDGFVLQARHPNGCKIVVDCSGVVNCARKGKPGRGDLGT